MPTAKEAFEQWKNRQKPLQIFQYNPHNKKWKEIVMSGPRGPIVFFNLIRAETSAKANSKGMPFCLFSVSRGSECLSLFVDGKCIWREGE